MTSHWISIGPAKRLNSVNRSNGSCYDSEVQRAHQWGVWGKWEVRSLKTCAENYPEDLSDMTIETCCYSCSVIVFLKSKLTLPPTFCSFISCYRYLLNHFTHSKLFFKISVLILWLRRIADWDTCYPICMNGDVICPRKSGDVDIRNDKCG